MRRLAFVAAVSLMAWERARNASTSIFNCIDSRARDRALGLVVVVVWIPVRVGDAMVISYVVVQSMWDNTYAVVQSM